MTLHGGPSLSPFPQPTTQAMRYIAVLYKSAFLACIVYGYMMCTNSIHRAGGLLAACLFVIIEIVWNTVSHEDSITGKLTVRGWQGHIGHSSFAQFWSNIIFAPAILYLYRHIVPTPIIRVLLFPVNIWLLEICEGYIIMFIFGRNVAWEYRGPDSFCHGNIKMQYFLPWLGLGLFVEVTWDSIFETAVFYIFSNNIFPYAMYAAGMVTLLVAPRMSCGSILNSINPERFY